MYDLNKLAETRRETAKQVLINLGYPLSQIEDTLPNLKDCEDYHTFVFEINTILKDCK